RTGPGNTRGTPCSTTCFTGNSPSPPNQIFSPIPRREDPQEQPDNEAGRSPTRTPPRTPQSRHTIEFNAAPTADRWIGAKRVIDTLAPTPVDGAPGIAARQQPRATESTTPELSRSLHP